MSLSLNETLLIHMCAYIQLRFETMLQDWCLVSISIGSLTDRLSYFLYLFV